MPTIQSDASVKMLTNKKEGHLKALKQIIILIHLTLTVSCRGHVEADFNKTPLFFVHGHGMKAKSWEPLISYLDKSGYPREYLRAIQLSPNDGPNVDAAEKQIAPVIEAFLDEINAFIKKKHPAIPKKTKVDLISHSMGALSARWYAAKVRPDRVRIWTCLGGANHGSNVLCGYPGQGADDLCPAYAKNRKESFVQYSLNGEPHEGDIDETPYGLGKDSPGVDSVLPDQYSSIVYVSIRTSPDKWIKPEDSPILDGAGGVRILIPENVKARETSPGNIIMNNGVGHDEMLRDGDTMRLVEIILNQANR